MECVKSKQTKMEMVDGSVVKNMYCLSMGPEFNSQYPCWMAELPIYSSRRPDISGLHVHSQ